MGEAQDAVATVALCRGRGRCCSGERGRGGGRGRIGDGAWREDWFDLTVEQLRLIQYERDISKPNKR